MVKFTVCPTVGTKLSAVLETATSAIGVVVTAVPLMVAVELLFEETGSVSGELETVAVLDKLPEEATVAAICNIADCPVGKAPTVQTPVPLTYVPCVALA